MTLHQIWTEFCVEVIESLNNQAGGFNMSLCMTLVGSFHSITTLISVNLIFIRRATLFWHRSIIVYVIPMEQSSSTRNPFS